MLQAKGMDEDIHSSLMLMLWQAVEKASKASQARQATVRVWPLQIHMMHVKAAN
jgi:hypothetical protein